jgi:ribosomal protein S18 acetylase RimI-like enzyme
VSGLAARRAATQQSFYSLLPTRSPAAGVLASVVPQAPGRSLFNAVTYRDAAPIPGLLTSLADLYAGAGVHAWTVWVLPGDGELLRAPLEAAGHRLDATPEAMGAVLADLDLDGPDVGGPCGWDELVAVNEAAYGVPAGDMGALRLLGEGVRRYAVPGAGVVLATHDHEHDAGVTVVAARPEARGRGLVTALLRQALREAVARGCTTTTLESTKLGRPVYERIGYRSLGTLEMWERRAGPPARA